MRVEIVVLTRHAHHHHADKERHQQQLEYVVNEAEKVTIVKVRQLDSRPHRRHECVRIRPAAVDKSLVAAD